ncbi:MAG TPA: protease [Ramlibacter sp.]|nr:protease [Ramlibacter sp.]
MKAKTSDLMTRMLRPIFERLTAYMGRAGLIAFVVDGDGAPPPADTLLGGDTPPGDKPADTPPIDAKPSDTPPGDKPADDAKPPADAKPEDKKPDDKPAGAPEAYEAFTLPEGMSADAPLMGEFAALAKELNMPQEAAQKFVNLAGKMQAGSAEHLQAAIDAQAETWGNDSKADKEFGGDAFDENLAIAKTALDKFGTPELKNLLNQSKLGNHPEVLRFFVRAGKAISQDGFIPGRTGAAADTAKRMYANSNMNP